MLERFGLSLRLGVARDSLTLVRTGGWRAPAVAVLGQVTLAPRECDNADQIGARLAELLAETGCAGAGLCVVLADDLVRMWQVAPPPGAGRLADLEAAAAMRFQALYGEPPAAWMVQADWDARAPFLACAVPRPLLAVLQQQALAQRLTLLEIVPQFVAAWNRWRHAIKPGAWFALVHDGLLTVGALASRRLCAVRSVPLPPGASLAWLEQHLAREALRLNLEAPAHLQVCGALACAGAPGASLQVARLDTALLDQLAPGAALAHTGARK